MTSRLDEITKYWPWRLVRLPILGFVLLSSSVVLGFSAYTVRPLDEPEGYNNGYGAVALGITCLTILSIVPMLICDLFRPGRFLSWVAVELGWFSVLWILWLATATVTTNANVSLIYSVGCHGDHKTLCEAWKVIQAFSYLNWIALISYVTFLTIFALLIRRRRGHDIIWTATVRDTDFLSWKAKSDNVSAKTKNSPNITFHISKFWPWRFVRLPVLYFIILTSTVVLAMGAFSSEPGEHPSYDSDRYGAVATVAAVVTLISFFPMLVIDYIKPGSFISWIAFELGWFSILSLLWFATLLVTRYSDVSIVFNAYCDGDFDSAVCQTWGVILGFSFLNCMILLSYVAFLLVFGIFIRKRRGHKVMWTATVRDTDFLDWKFPGPLRLPSAKRVGAESIETDVELQSSLPAQINTGATCDPEPETAPIGV